MRFFERFWSGLFGRAEPVKVKAPAAAPAANLYVVSGKMDPRGKQGEEDLVPGV